MTRTLTGTELKRLHRERRRATEGRVALVLDDVQNPFNVGAIVRTAAALGVDHVWLVGATPPLTHPKVQKTALGTQRYLSTSTAADVEEAARAARDEGYEVVGIELAEGATPLHELTDIGDVAIVVGHEDRGLSKAALTTCTRIAYVPQIGKIASLNVATATAIALYEVRRHHWA